MDATSFEMAEGAWRPHWGLRYSVAPLSSGSSLVILKRLNSGTTGCSETALVTTTVTSGTRPATADIMKLVDPWQWMTALILSQPVCSTTFLTARGWSNTAALSRFQVLGLRSMLARQFSSHTS